MVRIQRREPTGRLSNLGSKERRSIVRSGGKVSKSANDFVLLDGSRVGFVNFFFLGARAVSAIGLIGCGCVFTSSGVIVMVRAASEAYL